MTMQFGARKNAAGNTCPPIDAEEKISGKLVGLFQLPSFNAHPCKDAG